MVKLIEISAFGDLLPLATGTCSLDEIDPGFVTLVTPAAGQGSRVAEALKKQFGFGFPKPNRALAKGDTRIIWFGPGQAIVCGPKIVRIAGAICVDQSDGWGVMTLAGSDARAVLARLLPIDLRSEQFKRGHTARTLLGHLPVSITRVGDGRFQLMVFRSMAGTAVHDISRAMAGVAARSVPAGR